MPRNDKRSGPVKPAGRRRKIPGEEFLYSRAGSAAWHYDFQIDGARFRGSCGASASLEQAAAFAQARHDAEFRRIRLGEKPGPSEMTMNDAFARFYVEAAKGTAYGEQSRKYQMGRMLRLMGPDTLLSDLDDARINDFVQLMRTTPLAETGVKASRTAGPATINRYLDTLAVICARARSLWGVQVGEWSRAKFRSERALQEPPAPERYVEREQARALLREATAHTIPLIALDLMTGLRKANVVQLRWEQVSIAFGRMLLVGKGDKEISVPLTPDAVKLLERIEPDPAKRSGAVFYYGNPSIPCTCSACTRPRMGLIGRQFVNPKRSIRTAFRRVGLEKFRFHDLRHTFASWLLNESGDLKLVQEALHHQNIQTTLRYAHLLEGRRAAVTARATAGLFEPPPATALPAHDEDGEKVA